MSLLDELRLESAFADHDDLAGRAADEIERLTAQVERARAEAARSGAWEQRLAVALEDILYGDDGSAVYRATDVLRQWRNTSG